MALPPVTVAQTPRYTMYGNPNNGYKPTTMSGLVDNFRNNFLRKSIEIVPGLTMNQYEIVKRCYFYSHNQFESGPTDDNGEPKYFYDLMTDRNGQSTKNINFDTKDAYIKSETEGSYMKSWLLRREFIGYAKTSGFGRKLNDIAEMLPQFGTVVWKKIKLVDGGTDTAEVELINLMNDPSVKSLKDGTVIERHQLTQYDLYTRKSWDQDAVKRLVESGRTVVKAGYISSASSDMVGFANRVDEVTPYYDVYELWGEIPRDLYEHYKTGGLPSRRRGADKDPVQDEVDKFYAKPGETENGRRPSPVAKRLYEDASRVNGGSYSPGRSFSNEMVYVMAVVAGVGSASDKESVLFCKEVSRDLFPYKECHYRRRKGRWLGVGNYELCFPLIEKANEVTNRFFGALRIALMHIYQTTSQGVVRNVMTDMLDGDVVVSKERIEAIATEIRGLNEYNTELVNIERRADRLCNSFEVVTGENLPTNLPFRLGAQMMQTANKLFEFVREGIGIFLEEVFNEWLLPDFAKAMSPEHIMELLDDADDMEVYFEAKRKLFQFEIMKQYILENNEMPSAEELAIVGSLVKDQVKRGPKQIRIEKDYYANQKYVLKTRFTSENDATARNGETMTTLFQALVANPAALQDQKLMKIMNMILENAGLSPLDINVVAQTPANPSLNPAMAAGAGAGGVQPDPSAAGAQLPARAGPVAAGR